jgi:hypothetical protein
MSYLNVSLRIYGELPELLEMNNLIGVNATIFHKKGDALSRSTQKNQPIDIWILDLTPEIDHKSTKDKIYEQLLQAEILLENICLKISTIDREKMSADLYISYTASEHHNSFMLPAALINAADTANLEINFSFLTILNTKE